MLDVHVVRRLVCCAAMRSRKWLAALCLAGALAHRPAAQAIVARDDAHPGRIAIQVHRADGERAGAGFEVRVFDSLTPLWFPGIAPFWMFSAMRRLPAVARTDDQGVAWIEEPCGPFGVLASADGWAGLLQGMRLPDPPLAIEVVWDVPLPVRVVDANGAAVANANVGLVSVDERGIRDLIECATTGEDGTAVLHSALWRSSGRPGRIGVLAANADPRTELCEVDLANPPSEPIVLALGPTGTIDVALVDAAGQLVEASGIAWYDFTGDRLPAQVFREFAFTHVPLIGGRARLERVPVGLDVGLQVSAVGAITDVSQGARVEPRIESARLESAGQRLQSSFLVRQVLPRVHARLLARPGEPLSDRRVFVRWNDGLGREERQGTDADGGVSSCSLDGRSSGEFQVEFSCFEPQTGRRSARASFTLSGPDYHELGDLVLAPDPLLASGRVVDELGEPLVRAAVYVYELPDDGIERSRRDLFAITGTDGSFALQGTLDGGKLVLEASHHRALAVSRVEVAPGSSDVRLALAHAGVIEIQPRFDEGRKVNLAFEAVDATGVTMGRSSMSSGTYRIEGLPPGEYTLRCEWPDADSLLAEIPRVVVRAGETARDPRCTPLDLRGKLP